MSTSDLRASLIARGFITPITPSLREDLESPVVLTDGTIVDAYETRFEGPVIMYDRDGLCMGPNGETWRLPPLKNQWMHDWSRRVSAGQPVVRQRAGRFAYYGGAV